MSGLQSAIGVTPDRCLLLQGVQEALASEAQVCRRPHIVYNHKDTKARRVISSCLCVFVVKTIPLERVRRDVRKEPVASKDLEAVNRQTRSHSDETAKLILDVGEQLANESDQSLTGLQSDYLGCQRSSVR